MPEIFPTACGAIQLEYDRPNGAYLEMEVYENGDISLFCQNSLISSLSSAIRELIRKILKFPITEHVLVDLPTTKIYVIADNPSTSDVYSYASIYTDFLRKSDSYFDFMVHSVDKIDERGFDYKITPESWECRYSYPRDIERIKEEVRDFHTQGAKH